MTKGEPGAPRESSPLTKPSRGWESTAEGSQRYRIRVRERLDERWSEWFDGLTVAPAGADGTIVSGVLADQAALHGVLARVRDLNLTLLSVTLVGDDLERQ